MEYKDGQLDQKSLKQVFWHFYAKNHRYIWLSTMLKKAETTKVPDSTLIIGSSYSLNGIYEPVWKNAINCSMHSQDIYYDLKCAEKVVRANGEHFTRCFLVMGYYMAHQDLSRTETWGEWTQQLISNVYYPIFHDSHHWKNPVISDPWEGLEEITPEVRKICMEMAEKRVWNKSFYEEGQGREPIQRFQGRWKDLGEVEKMFYAWARAGDHNKCIRYQESYQENKILMEKLIDCLQEKNVTPILVVTPFTPEYNYYADKKIKENFYHIIDRVADRVEVVDFNEMPQLFDPADFMDTDHLSESGAKKVSILLTHMFGE